MLTFSRKAFPTILKNINRMGFNYDTIPSNPKTKHTNPLGLGCYCNGSYNCLLLEKMTCVRSVIRIKTFYLLNKK